jgi:hypothetical protein
MRTSLAAGSVSQPRNAASQRASAVYGRARASSAIPARLRGLSAPSRNRGIGSPGHPGGGAHGGRRPMAARGRSGSRAFPWAGRRGSARRRCAHFRCAREALPGCRAACAGAGAAVASRRASRPRGAGRRRVGDRSRHPDVRLAGRRIELSAEQLALLYALAEDRLGARRLRLRGRRPLFVPRGDPTS